MANFSYWKSQIISISPVLIAYLSSVIFSCIPFVSLRILLAFLWGFSNLSPAKMSASALPVGLNFRQNWLLIYEHFVGLLARGRKMSTQCISRASASRFPFPAIFFELLSVGDVVLLCTSQRIWQLQGGKPFLMCPQRSSP